VAGHEFIKQAPRLAVVKGNASVQLVYDKRRVWQE
jgi:hypothetical protein